MAPLVRWIQRVFDAHGIVMVTGENLHGDVLSGAISKRIAGSDALVAVFTKKGRATADQEGSWVKDELSLALGRKLPTLAIVEKGLPITGLLADREKVELDPFEPLLALLKLNEVLGAWQAKARRKRAMVAMVAMGAMVILLSLSWFERAAFAQRVEAVRDRLFDLNTCTVQNASDPYLCAKPATELESSCADLVRSR